MYSIAIKPVNSKKDLTQFIKMQWKFYKDDPYWVPPLISDKRNFFDKKKNPFFKHADLQCFIAVKDGKYVGRIAAIKNDMHNKYHGENIGFFGFFECINDQLVANKLFDTAKDWIKQKGCNAMRGPANPSSNDEWAMLLDGFDDSPRILMPYNPKYYLDLCENFGMKKVKDLYAYKLENDKVTSSDKLRRVADIAQRRSGLKVRSVNMKDFPNELEKFKYVYNKAWAPNWGFIPMTNEEIDAMAKELKPLVEPSLILFGEIGNQIVGAALVMLDYNYVLKKMNGRLFPFGFLKFFTERKNIKWARVLTLGIIPEYQKRGLDAVFYWEIVNRAHKIGIDLGEASWILEDNAMMNRGAEVMNGTIYKKYRIFEIPIE